MYFFPVQMSQSLTIFRIISNIISYNFSTLMRVFSAQTAGLKRTTLSHVCPECSQNMTRVNTSKYIQIIYVCSNPMKIIKPACTFYTKIKRIQISLHSLFLPGSAEDIKLYKYLNYTNYHMHRLCISQISSLFTHSEQNIHPVNKRETAGNTGVYSR